MLYLDIETCGLHGIAVLIQYAQDDGLIELYHVWKNKIKHTLELIEWICCQDVCAFNLVFDWFHIVKLYNTLRLFPDHEAYPEDYIKELAVLEEKARDGLCLRPRAALDLFLHARKGPYQSLMDRKDIKIKRVPTAIAFELAAELERRVPLPDIYFARKEKITKWQVDDILDDDGLMNPDFKNVVLRFAPTSALKALASDALGYQVDEILKFTDVECKVLPVEYGYAPFALAASKSGKAWPEVIHHHIKHWYYNEPAQLYASDDIKYLRELYNFFGKPAVGDDDSELAIMVAAIRWKGFKVDLDRIKELRQKALVKATQAPTAPNYVKNYIWPHLSDVEKATTPSTKKVVLEEIAKWEGHPAAPKAQEVLDARMAQKEVELYDKLLLAGRFHASFKIIGTLSGRMAGADGLNPQAIKATKEVRSCFPLAFEGYTLCGGDFESFEVGIGVAYYNDSALYEDLKKGKKIHALFGEELFPEEDYESILATKGTEDDLYKKAKSALFAMGMYGGTGYTVQERLGIDAKQGDIAKERWAQRYPGIGRKQAEVENLFKSMRQPGGIGTVVEWHDPADYIESMLGFRRYFTLENRICKALFDLGEKPPKAWTQYKFKVHRRDRDQTASGAARSACFAAAFAIQGANLRAANNHVIQSTGAEITKHVQIKVCELQPRGIHEWVVLPCNFHDELMVVCKPFIVEKLNAKVKEEVENYKPIIPLIAIDWSNNLATWADK